jgi:hypothetical protein
MGRREGGQGQFFYAFDLDKVVPADHLVRQIDAYCKQNKVSYVCCRFFEHLLTVLRASVV